MEGEQLPKATMNSFLKSRTNNSFNAEYLAKVLLVSKEFIARLSDRANVMCESYSKKTISAEHLEAAIKDFGMTDHLDDLRSLEDTIKEQNLLKREASQRMEEMLAKDLEEDRQRRREQEQQQLLKKKEVTVLQTFEMFQQGKKKEDKEEDYENVDNVVVDVDALSGQP